MKVVIVLALVALAVAHPEGYDKYADFNVQELIVNERLLKSYTLCFLGEGKCTPEGNDIKKWIPDAVTTSCVKCTEKQKGVIAKVIVMIQKKFPTEYEKLYKKNDPETKYLEELKKFIAKYAN